MVALLFKPIVSNILILCMYAMWGYGVVYIQTKKNAIISRTYAISTFRTTNDCVANLFKFSV